MSKHNYILTINVGFETLKVAEFLVSGKSLVLENFALQSYNSELSENISFTELESCFKNILSSHKFKAKKVYLSISGHYVFTRFSKIPSNMLEAKAQKIKQVINYEAKQNIPYSLDEVSWAYRLNKNENASDVEIMFSVIKTEHVLGIVSIFERAGFITEIVESDPSAIYKGAYGILGEDVCNCVLVNIGDRCTIVEFFDKESFFVRVIPIGGGLITQQISNALGIEEENAEIIKFENLSSIGVTKTIEVSEANLKKIQDISSSINSRIVGEVVQSVNIYKTQHNANYSIDKIYLCGGSCVIKNLDTSFSSKFNVPVEYLNLFKNVAISKNLDKQYFASVCHVFPENIGLARFSFENGISPTSLLPKSIENKHIASKKVPYYYGIVIVIFLTLLTIYFEISTQSRLMNYLIDESMISVRNKEAQIANINKLKAQLDLEKNLYNQMSLVVESKNRWFDIIRDIQDSLPDNVWISSISPTGTPNIKVIESLVEKKDTSNVRTIFGAKKNVKTQSKQITLTDFNSGNVDWIRINGYSLVVFNNAGTTEVEKFRDSLLKKASFGNNGDDVIINNYEAPKTESGNIGQFDILIKLKTPIAQ